MCSQESYDISKKMCSQESYDISKKMCCQEWSNEKLKRSEYTSKRNKRKRNNEIK